MKSGKMITENSGFERREGGDSLLGYRFIVGVKSEMNQDRYMFWAPEGKVPPLTEIENPRGAGLKVRMRS